MVSAFVDESEKKLEPVLQPVEVHDVIEPDLKLSYFDAIDPTESFVRDDYLVAVYTAMVFNTYPKPPVPVIVEPVTITKQDTPVVVQAPVYKAPAPTQVPVYKPTAVAVPTQATVVVSASYDNSTLWGAVSVYFSDEPEHAYRTFMCESGGNPNASGGGGLYRGVAQQDINIWGWPPADVYGQVAKARQIKDLSGWIAWPVCAYK